MSPVLVPHLVPFRVFEDRRGSFQKIFPVDEKSDFIDIKEIFWSRSSMGVVRGMHFQTSPFGGTKVVYVIQGRVADFCVNMSSESCEKGAVFFNELSENGEALVVPDGFAHGFQALQENTIVGYITDHIYAPDHEGGFNPLSHHEIQWPIVVNQISERDRKLPNFQSL